MFILVMQSAALNHIFYTCIVTTSASGMTSGLLYASDFISHLLPTPKNACPSAKLKLTNVWCKNWNIYSKNHTSQKMDNSVIPVQLIHCICLILDRAKCRQSFCTMFAHSIIHKQIIQPHVVYALMLIMLQENEQLTSEMTYHCTGIVQNSEA